MLKYSNDISKVIFFTNKVVKANKLCIQSVHFIKQRQNHAYLNIGTYNIRLYILFGLYNTCFYKALEIECVIIHGMQVLIKGQLQNK